MIDLDLGFHDGQHLRDRNEIVMGWVWSSSSRRGGI